METAQECLTEQPLEKTENIEEINKNNGLSKKLSNKTFIFSATFILILGLIFIGALYYLLNNPKNSNSQVSTSYPVTSEPTTLTLKLDSPDNNNLVFNPDLLIQGKTSPKAIVILSLSDKDLALTVDGEGNFNQTVSLSEGVNEISVASFDTGGNFKTENRTVYYSKEKI